MQKDAWKMLYKKRAPSKFLKTFSIEKIRCLKSFQFNAAYQFVCVGFKASCIDQTKYHLKSGIKEHLGKINR